MRRAQKNTTDTVESLFEDEFKELCGCRVVMQHSPVGESAANGAIENAISTGVAVLGRTCCPHATVLEDIRGRRSQQHAAAARRSSISASQKPGGGMECGFPSIEASGDHMIGTPRGAVKPTTATARPDGQGFEGKAIDAMQGTPWRPSSKHWGTKIRKHI